MSSTDVAVVDAAVVAAWLEDCPEEDVEDSPDSSWLSLAWAVARVPWASETCCCREVVSRVASDWPALTCWPTVTSTPATVPATWNDAWAWLTGSTVPEAVSVRTVLPMVATPVR